MQRRVDDFHDHNILSYVYEQKKHKSYELDQKKEANISKIMEAFPVHDKREQYSRTIGNEGAGINPTSGPTNQEQAQRKLMKKRKEMEAKLF